MPISLGIHIGHHASCAIVIDGCLVAAIQQERITRKKYDGPIGLHNDLPIMACLKAANLNMCDIDHIVTSFQGIASGGIGLRKPLIDPSFNLFDPFDERHEVISHHLAHSISSFGMSGFSEAAVLVCDLAGQTTESGEDFSMPFRDFYNYVASANPTKELKTESLSIYKFDAGGPKLLHREFVLNHCNSDIFVFSAASLYDNISRAIFGSENAHGQLMALAALEEKNISPPIFNSSDLMKLESNQLVFRNDWQEKVKIHKNALDHVSLAKATQDALSIALLHYVDKIANMSISRNFCGSGGIFLNIVGNSKISNSDNFEKYFFPSVPHDAGISVGCAYYGQRIWEAPNLDYMTDYVSDRLGLPIDDETALAAIGRHGSFIVSKIATAGEIAKLFVDGKIIARCAGRAEFGPRALGGRSLLASPLLLSTKNRLNKIKGRQEWRPVAPMVLDSALSTFFDGPECSPYMNYVHKIKEQYIDQLPALSLDDGSTRAQSIRAKDDLSLYKIVKEFGDLSGFSILVNTSLNGPKEPIIESADEAINFLRRNIEVDALLLNDILVARNVSWFQPKMLEWKVRLANGAMLTSIFPNGQALHMIVCARRQIQVNQLLSEKILAGCVDFILADLLKTLNPDMKKALDFARQYFDGGFLELIEN